MKKQFTRMIGAVCAAAMMASAAAAMPANAAETEVSAPRIMGDLTGDSRVSIEDAKRALDIVVASQAELCDNTANAENDAADINMNGTIEIQDAKAILNYFCQTLVDGQPLWADVRKLSYEDGTSFHRDYVSDKDAKEGKALPFEKRGMYLEIGCAEGAPGETVAVPVYLAGVKEFAGMQYFQTAPDVLKLIDIKSILTSDETDADGNKIPKTPNGMNGVINCNNGGFVWANEKGDNLKVEDGTVIAEYYYTIPENAQAGDLFVISADKTDTMFVTVDDSDGFNCLSYQYTLLDGVVAVK